MEQLKSYIENLINSHPLTSIILASLSGMSLAVLSSINATKKYYSVFKKENLPGYLDECKDCTIEQLIASDKSAIDLFKKKIIDQTEDIRYYEARLRQLKKYNKSNK